MSAPLIRISAGRRFPQDWPQLAEAWEIVWPVLQDGQWHDRWKLFHLMKHTGLNKDTLRGMLKSAIQEGLLEMRSEDTGVMGKNGFTRVTVEYRLADR